MIALPFLASPLVKIGAVLALGASILVGGWAYRGHVYQQGWDAAVANYRVAELQLKNEELRRQINITEAVLAADQARAAALAAELETLRAQVDDTPENPDPGLPAPAVGRIRGLFK